MFKVFTVHCTDGTYFWRTLLPLISTASKAVYSFQVLVCIYQISSVTSQKAVSFMWWDAAIYSVSHMLLLNVLWRTDICIYTLCLASLNVDISGQYNCFHCIVSLTRWSVVVQPSQSLFVTLCHFCKDVSKCMHSITFLVCSQPFLHLRFTETGSLCCTAFVWETLLH